MGLVGWGRRNLERRLWYPALLPLLPVLSLYTANRSEVPWPLLLRPAALVLAAATLMSWLLRRLRLDPQKAGLITAGCWLWWFGWGHFVAITRGQPELRGVLEMYPAAVRAGWVALLVAAVAVIALGRRPPARLGVGLNLAALALVLAQLVMIVPHAWRSSASTHGPVAALPAGSAQPGQRPPDIFFIVLDGYARQDVLARMYGYDNGPFLRGLERRGFTVLGRSTANYCQTELSQASTLNCTYLGDLAHRLGPGSVDRVPLDRMIHDSLVSRKLRQQGYHVVELMWYAQGWEEGRAPVGWDTGRLLNGFEVLLLEMTPWPPATARGEGGQRLTPRAECTLRMLREIGNYGGGRRPVFLFAHVLCPHPPFDLPPQRGQRLAGVPMLDLADGNYSRMSRAEYVTRYRAQLEYLNRKVEAALDRLLARAGPDAIVILMSDHGPGSRLNWDDPKRTFMKERFANLCALRLPHGGQARLWPEMSAVNIFRVILSHYFGADLPPLPDDCYYSPWLHPYRFTKVTGRVRTEAWPGAR